MRLMDGETILEQCNPNRHGTVYLTVQDNKYSETGKCYAIYEPDEEGYYDQDPQEYENERLARAYYNSRIKELNTIPNWKAQQEYDERWGDPLDRDTDPSEY